MPAKTNSAPTIVLFRSDLRLSDHPALHAAVERGGPILPVFVYDAKEGEPWKLGAASRWWLHHSLQALHNDLQSRGSRLIVVSGNCTRKLTELIEHSGASAVFWNRRYEPSHIAHDTKLKVDVRSRGCDVESFNGSLLREPMDVKSKTGQPYQVFTPYWKTCLTFPEPPAPLPAPRTLNSPSSWPASVELDDLKLLPRIDWAGGFRESWCPGETGAKKLLNRFLEQAVSDYHERRDFPAETGTSRLSPHLHFGEISPTQIWHAVQDRMSHADGRTKKSADRYLSEIGWREFAHHLLFHFPKTTDEPLRPEFAKFPWRTDSNRLRVWQKGLTGYPIVDAGMRELWHTGWMHNRVRMVVASFLVKDLLISWREGASWFWDTLVDADLANNTLGWQWAAGCGADAAPYVRVFNPALQSRRFDPHGAYLRRWLPELAKLPDDLIHAPDAAAPLELREAGVVLGKDYPRPIVDHGRARQEALEAFAARQK